MNNFNTWFTVLMLAIFGSMLVVALQYPPGARFMPLVVGIPGFVLCAVQLIVDFQFARKGQVGAFHAAPRAGEHAVEPEVLPEFGPHTAKEELKMWAYVLAFIGGILAFGFVVAVPILVLTYLAREAEVRLPQAFVAAVVATGFMYLMFEHVFRLMLHPGFVTPQVLRALGM